MIVFAVLLKHCHLEPELSPQSIHQGLQPESLKGWLIKRLIKAVTNCKLSTGADCKSLSLSPEVVISSGLPTVQVKTNLCKAQHDEISTC